jgi:hypothetical protein
LLFLSSLLPTSVIIVTNITRSKKSFQNRNLMFADE